MAAPRDVRVGADQHQLRTVDWGKARFGNVYDLQWRWRRVDQRRGIGVAKTQQGEPRAEMVVERTAVGQEHAGQARARCRRGMALARGQFSTRLVS